MGLLVMQLSLGYSFHPTYSLTSNSSKLTHMSVCTVINSLLWAVIGVLLGISLYIVYRNFTQQYREENQTFESASKRSRRLENGVVVFFFLTADIKSFNCSVNEFIRSWHGIIESNLILEPVGGPSGCFQMTKGDLACPLLICFH